VKLFWSLICALLVLSPASCSTLLAQSRSNPRPMIGFVLVASTDLASRRAATVTKRLAELGSTRGDSYNLEIRSTMRLEELDQIMRELVDQKMNIIVTSGDSIRYCCNESHPRNAYRGCCDG
jgi:hypothetical protein